jgi:transcription factor E
MVMLMAGYYKQVPKMKIQAKNKGKIGKTAKLTRPTKVAKKKVAKTKVASKARHMQIKKTNKSIKTTKKLQKVNRLKEQVAKNTVETVKFIDEMINNKDFSDYIIKNVGRKAIDILSTLNEPLSDEELASKLDIKINEVRRILNTLNTYGITKYDTLKDKNGWLTFKWYINANNIEKVKKTISESSKSAKYKLPDDCNDFFICDTCFEKSRVLFPFDTAVEMKFKCDCGGNLVRISKEDAQRLIEKGNTVAH